MTLGVFARIMEGLAFEDGEQKTIMIDATYLKAHRAASSLRAKKGGPEVLHDCKAGNDYTGATALLGSLPAAEWTIADRGYDADWFREALKDKEIRPCIPG